MGQERFKNEMTELHPEQPKDLTGSDKKETKTRIGQIEGRNAVQEALRAGKTADRLYLLDGMRDPAIGQIISRVKKQGATVSFVSRQLLDQMSETGKHQGVILQCSAYEYASMEDISSKLYFDYGNHPLSSFWTRSRIRTISVPSSVRRISAAHTGL